MAGNSNSGRKKVNTESAQRARRALAQLSIRSLQAIKQAVSEGDVATAKWVIEMNLGKPKQQTEISGPDGGPIQVDDAREKLFDRVQLIAERQKQLSENRN